MCFSFPQQQPTNNNPSAPRTDDNDDGPDNKLVVNLSSFQLEKRHVNLLNRGLKFCPRPDEPDPGQSRSDLDHLHKRLRQTSYFQKQEEDDLGNSDTSTLVEGSPFKHHSFKKTSKFNPPGPLNLEAMILANEEHFNSRKAYSP